MLTLISVSVNQKSLEMDSGCDQNDKRDQQLYKISPHFFVSKKSRKQKEIVQVGNGHRHNQLDNAVGCCFSPIDITTMSKIADRVKKERQVNAPEGDMYQDNPVSM